MIVNLYVFSVKLHTGGLNTSGVAEIFTTVDYGRNYWQPVTLCADGFDNFTASLFCTELGHNDGGFVYAFSPYTYLGGANDFRMVNCSGKVTHFNECSVEQAYYCQSATVHCFHPVEDGGDAYKFLFTNIYTYI